MFGFSVLRVLRDMALCLAREDWPVLCVRIPEREAVFEQEVFERELSTFAEFADTLLADRVYAIEAFHGDQGAEPAREWWLPYDPHWAQAGSDRFAAWFYPQLRTWLAANCPVAATPGP